VRRLICILLLLCLPLQSFAVQGGALLFVSTSGQGIGHELDHAAEIEHHHDDDGSVHYDGSEESAQHIEDHSSCAQVAFLAVPFQSIAPEQGACAADGALARFIPDPCLDSPLRPPAPTLGHAAGGAKHA
jgi:hypothetical protein